MQKVLLVGSGEDLSNAKLQHFASGCEYIIACDGGYDTLINNNISPHILLGDLDSIKTKKLPEELEIIKYNTEKDLSDSEIGIQKAMDLGATDIYLFGFTGSYFDHSYANIINLVRNHKKGVNIDIITSNSTIKFINKSYKLFNSKNKRCSFFPLSKILGINLKGFKYNFNKNNLDFSDYSLSNVIISDEAKISFTKGKMILIVFDSEYK